MEKVVAHIDTMLTLKPNSCIISKKWIKYDLQDSEEKTMNENSLKNLLKDGAKTENMNGYLSDASRRHLKTITENLFMAIEMETGMKYGHPSQVYPTFITLTMPSKQLHHDNYIKDHCLGPFIEWLKSPNTYITQRGKSKGLQQGCNVKSYVWRAESQKNGNIHFHIVCDRWIDKDQIRWRWNMICEKLGYVTRYAQKEKFIYKNGFKYSDSQLKTMKEKLQSKLIHALKTGELPKVHQAAEDRFIKAMRDKRKFGYRELNRLAIEVLQANYEKKKAENFSDPPSTQIIQIMNKSAVTAYITKYIAKPSEEKKPRLKIDQEILVVENEFTLKREKFIVTYKYEDDGNGNELRFEQKREPYIVQFDSRPIKGRLWGRSDEIFDLKPPKVRAYTFQIIDTEVITETVSKRKVPVYEKDLFGSTTTVSYKFVEHTTTDREIRRSYKADENKVAWGYIDTMRSLVGYEVIKEATAKVGGTFEAFGGEVIPVYERTGKNVKYQRHFLEENAPELYNQYKEYYAEIFTNLYGHY